MECTLKFTQKSQLILLRRLKPLLKKKYQLPDEIMDKIEIILKDRKLGEKRFCSHTPRTNHK